jgi:hypothetical protein
MSAYTIVHDVGLELRRQVFEAVNSAADAVFALPSLASVSLSAPHAVTDSGVAVSLYLYHVHVDEHLRNRDWLPDRTEAGRLRRPPIPLRLRYLLTPMDADESNNHLRLGRVVQHFHDAPSFAVADGAPVGDSFGAASPQLRVRPDMLAVEQLAQIWNAFQEPMRLSLSLVVEIVAVDSARPPRSAPRVLESVVAAGRRARP